MDIRLLREYVKIALKRQTEALGGSYPEEQYQDATSDNLKLAEPGTIVEPDVRKKIGVYLSKMGLLKGPPPKNPKGPKRKTRLG